MVEGAFGIQVQVHYPEELADYSKKNWGDCASLGYMYYYKGYSEITWDCQHNQLALYPRESLTR